MVKIPGGRIDDSELIYGMVVEKERISPEMPKKVEKARIMLLEGTLELKKLDTDAKITITEAKSLASFKEARRSYCGSRLRPLPTRGRT